MKTFPSFSALEKKIAAVEKKLAKQKLLLADLRKEVPKKKTADYVFEDLNGKKIKLSKLFGSKNELILIHNMGKSCVYCTMWADGFNGIYHHLEDRAAFALITPDNFKAANAFAKSRNWKFRIASSYNNTFKADMGFESGDRYPFPGVSVFVKDKKGNIFHTSKAFFGPGDNYCITWDLFDLLPGGSNNWHPKFNYKK